MLPCSLCRGLGFEECYDCAGSGYFEDEDDEGTEMPCETCQGMGEFECPRCEGEGEEVVKE